MASQLHHYLVNFYEPQLKRTPLNGRSPPPVQVDDQNDHDNIERFCTVFVTVQKRDELLIELEGWIPVNESICRYAQEHNGHVDASRSKIALLLPARHIDELAPLADMLRKTGTNGFASLNPDWPKLSLRTADSLKRLIRTVQSYPDTGEAAGRQ